MLRIVGYLQTFNLFALDNVCLALDVKNVISRGHKSGAGAASNQLAPKRFEQVTHVRRHAQRRGSPVQ